MISRRHHEIKISYLKYRIRNMIHGYFGKRGGHNVVYITYDPTNRSIKPDHKRILRIDTEEGRIAAEAVTEYIEKKAELQYLMELWNATYCREPREIQYPLRKVRKNIFNSQYFKDAKPNMNDYKREELKIEYKGQWFRSKNEMSAAQIINEMGYKFKSEIHVALAHSDLDHFPDVSFDVEELDLMMMAEIDGKLDKGNYRLKSMERQYGYFDDGFREFKDIVFMRLSDPTVFDPEHFKMLVYAAIEANIDDVIY